MPLYCLFEILVYCLVLMVIIKPLGLYSCEVIYERRSWVSRFGGHIEVFLNRVAGVDMNVSMTALQYGQAFFLFHLVGLVVLYLILSFQNQLFFFLEPVTVLSWDQALNIAISFITHTNWQPYIGEIDLNMGSQVIGLMVQQFLAAASSLCLCWVFIRSFFLDGVDGIGNFWVDLLRSILYILLPLSLVLGFLFITQGVINTWKPELSFYALETGDFFRVAAGPLAASEAIKIIGTNGGGMYVANSAHPLANPTIFSHFFQMIGMLALPAALCYTFGRMVGDVREGLVFLWVMLSGLILGLLVIVYADLTCIPEIEGLNSVLSAWGPGGNMEGKEVRFGIVGSSLFSALTTATSCGATNSILSSFASWGQMIFCLFLSAGEVIFGGVGTGICSMIGVAILTVFLLGLMIGRTPQYLRKKIESFEMQMVAVMVLAPAVIWMLILCVCIYKYVPSTVNFDSVKAIVYNLFSVIYNNGSSFDLGISGPVWNVLTAFMMLVGRLCMVLPVLALSGSLAQKPRLNEAGVSFSTKGILFFGLLCLMIFLISILNYMPFLVLMGPLDFLGNCLGV